MAKNIYDFIPRNARNKLDKNSKVCPLSSHDILNVLKHDKIILMACNTRIKHVIPGIMKAADELDAIVAFELAKSEGNLKGGYTGMNPEQYANIVFDYAEQIKFYKPFFIHGDHVTTKSPDPVIVGDSKDLIEAELKAGYTSIAVDASFNPTADNVKVSTELGKLAVEAGAGLEVEVGEILSTGTEARITSVEDAIEFLKGLIEDNHVHPDLLAINNGSKHGNYKSGEDVHIDLQRTGEIYNAIIKWDVAIAQHGITGTPLNLVGQFADYGIRKGNVGTNWQNIAHAGLPRDLFDTMQKWAKENNKDIKFATKQFLNEINNIPETNKQKIIEDSYLSAKEFILAFRANGTAGKVVSSLTH